MTMTEDELARPLTAEEEARLRDDVRHDVAAVANHRPDWTPMEWTGPFVTRLLATLDATRKAADGAYGAGKLDAEGEYHAFALPASPVADTAGIDAAWREADAALPAGWRPIRLAVDDDDWTRWEAVTSSRAFFEDETSDEDQMGEGSGPTPAAALLALAAALRTPKPEGEP